MKYAGKIGAQYTLVLGDDEIEKGVYALKNMNTGEVTQIDADEFVEEFIEIVLTEMEAELREMLEMEDDD